MMHATETRPDERRSDVVRSLMGAISVITGLAGAAAVLWFGAWATGDNASTSETLALLAGVSAPLAGGIATCVTARVRWLLAGAGTGALMYLLLLQIADGQPILT